MVYSRKIPRMIYLAGLHIFRNLVIRRDFENDLGVRTFADGEIFDILLSCENKYLVKQLENFKPVLKYILLALRKKFQLARKNSRIDTVYVPFAREADELFHRSM